MSDEDVFAFTFSKEELIILNRSLNLWLATLRAASRGNEPQAGNVIAVLRRVDETIGVAESIEKRRKTDRARRKSGGAKWEG